MNLVAVVVCYHPCFHALYELASTLSNRCSLVLLIDNSETNDVADLDPFPKNCRLVRMGENTGIARAQNVGISIAIEERADAIAFFDQDSLVTEELIEGLCNALDTTSANIVAPVCVDKDTAIEMPSYRLSKAGLPKKVFATGLAPYPVDLVISSGCIVSVPTFDVVGGMNEDLFIDYVDFEWCARCRRLDVPVTVVPRVVLHHKIGEGITGVGRIRGAIHSPHRTYYKVRNPFLLLRGKAMPKTFVLRELMGAITHALLVLTSVAPKGLYFDSIKAGILDGLSNSGGKRKL